MRHLMLVALAAIACSALAASSAPAQQTGIIAGRIIRAESAAPVVGAQVLVVGTRLGALTDAEGRYQIPGVTAGAHTVRVQMMGYSATDLPVTVAAGQTAVADFQLREQAIDMAPVVVTALGIEKEERGLGYAVQTVSSNRIAEVPQVNVIAALKGQVAGVQINTASSRPGGANRIVIRGESSFSGGGQPLWVVDGVPISMDTDEQSGLDDTFELEVGQAGNRGMDLDPNNIESISVLRGAAATALYGSRGASGVIVITTKRGTPGAPTRFTLTTRFQHESPIFGGKQTDYTAGNQAGVMVPSSPGYGPGSLGNVFFCNALAPNEGGWCETGYPSSTPTTYWNWGPHKDSLSAEVLAHDGGVRMVDPRSDYYRNGLMRETAINAAGGIAGGGSFNLGGSYVSHGGIEPTTDLSRLNLNANIMLPLTERLTTNTMVMFSNSVNEWHDEGYEGAERQLMLNFPANRDLRDAWTCPDEGGTPQNVRDDYCGLDIPVMFGNNSPHFDWLAENQYRSSQTRRWIASQMIRYDILPNLSIQNRLGLDTYNDHRHQFEAERPWRTANGQTSGGSLQGRVARTGLQNDLILSLAPTPMGRGLTLSGLVGGNVQLNENDDLLARAEDITIPGFYHIDNFESQRVDETIRRKTRLVGIYSQATVDYADWAFLTLTGRNDWSSTLPSDGNNYFYPSASVGLVFTDALGIRTSWLDFGKLRLSVAKVGNDAPPYRLTTTYDQEGAGLEWPYKEQLGYMQGNSLGNPGLKPESTREYEVGLDLRGLGGRAALDVTYYDKRSYDQIFSVPSSSASGYSSIIRNAGNLKNAGVEVSLQVVPIQTDRLRWDIQANYSRNKSEVLELAPGVETLPLAGYSWPQIRIMANQPYGVIWGYGLKRDENGNPLIYGSSAASDGDARSVISGDFTEPGYPIWDDALKVIGNIQPDWTGSLYSSLRYGPFGLSGMFTSRQGGDILNFDLNYTITNGASSLTAVRNDAYVYKGINGDTGEPNDEVVYRNKDFWEDYGCYNCHEHQIEDGSFIRLQNLQLSYDLPQQFLSRFGMSSLQLFAQGNNLNVWTDFSTGDPQGSNYGSSNAGGGAFRFFLPPTTRSYTFGLRTTF